MKLLSYTYRKLALLLFLLMAVWGVLFYYAIIDEVVDETDDTLENYGEMRDARMVAQNRGVSMEKVFRG